MAAWMLPNEGALTDAQRRQAMENFAGYVRRVAVTYAEVARQVNRPRTTTIGDLVKGKYTEHSDEHVRTLNNWIEQHARRQAVKLRGNFVSTKVAEDIHHVARLVRENATIGLVYGPTGIGKTCCAQALHDTTVGSVLVTVIFGGYHPRGLTTLLAQQLGVRATPKGKELDYVPTQLERVLSRLKDSHRLIIVDEAHKLNNEAVELLREIHDATGCPILLLATKDLHDRVDRNADPDRGQIYSRFEIDRPLTEGRGSRRDSGKALFTIEDIRKLYEQTPIRLSPDAARYLQDVANSLGFGSLRRCRILLTNAARRARKRCGVDEEDTVTVTADDLACVEELLRANQTDKEMVKERRQAIAATA
ncbi:MAG: ATP-binding protein [Planctomycetota bacterium]